MFSRSSHQFQSAVRICRWQKHPKRWHANGNSSKSSDQVDYIAPKALAIGSLAGLCGSLVGLGGGFVMIPMMTSRLIKLSQHQAHGTSLFAVTTTGIAGALGYSGKVDFEAAAAIAMTGMVSARLGAMATSLLSEKMLRKALGVSMICVAPLVPMKTYFMKSEKEGKKNTKDNDGSVDRLIVPAMIGKFRIFPTKAT